MATKVEVDHMYKFVLVGNAGVGKSSLLMQFTENDFQANYITTIGVDFKIRILNLDGELYKLHVWDTAGQERFKTIVTTYYRGAHGVLIVYDVTNEESFADVKSWLHEVYQNCHNAIIIIVGNKCDMAGDENMEHVKTELGEEYASEHGLQFFETSAKENINVKEVFEELTRQVKRSEREARRMDISDFSGIVPNLEVGNEDRDKQNRTKCCQ